MDKRLQLLKKMIFFEKEIKSIYDNKDWGSKSDWASYLDKNNPRNVYCFVNEMINNKILIFDKVINERKNINIFKLNKGKFRNPYIKKLKQLIEQTSEFELFDELYNIYD